MGERSPELTERNRAVYLAWCRGASLREVGREFEISFQRVAEIIRKIEKHGVPAVRYDYKTGAWEFSDVG
jgi:Mor family transcriptional regulator